MALLEKNSSPKERAFNNPWTLALRGRNRFESYGATANVQSRSQNDTNTADKLDYMPRDGMFTKTTRFNQA
jgi:hypothetical protein